MKLNLKKRDESGTVFLATTVVVIGITTLLVLSYFWLLMGQSKAVERSQSWNRSMTLAEAGVEEALAQLNWGPTPGFGDFSANGWTQHASTNPSLSSYGPPGERILVDGSYYSRFIASPAGGAGATAMIYSTGMVRAPISGKSISRKVLVTAAMAPLFPDAIDAVNGMTFTGNALATAAWNSYDPTLSTNGQFWAGHTTNGGASIGIESGSASLGNDTIDGNVYLGPNVTGGTNKSAVTGTIYNDYNIQIADASLPAGALWNVAVPTNIVTSNVSTNKKGVVTTTYSTNKIFDFTQSGNYQIPANDGNIQIQIEAGITATLDVKATTFAPGNVNILGGQNNSGTGIIYQESGSATLTGGGYRPANFIYYGLPGVTSLRMDGNSSGVYIGVVYAPEANMDQNGTAAVIEGSVTVNTYKRNGNATVYYDSSLGTNAQKGFVPTSWREF